jgi:hypothetical protein
MQLLFVGERKSKIERPVKHVARILAQKREEEEEERHGRD